MAHKIIVTGTPLKIRFLGDKVTLDFTEKGSTAAPKGLPTSKEIRYTCLMNKKQFTKLDIPAEEIKNHRYIIKGEPTLDLSTRDCPGEIGIIVFEIEVIVPKVKSIDNIPDHIIESDKPISETPQQKEEIPMVCTTLLIDIDEITVPQEFLERTPNKFKTMPVIEHVQKTGTIDKPVIIDPITKTLVDGYRRYYVARMFNLEKIPYTYPDQIA